MNIEETATMNTTETESIRHQVKIADLPFVENRAAAETAQTLRDELLYQRGHPDLSLGLAADQHAGHAARL